MWKLGATAALLVFSSGFALAAEEFRLHCVDTIPGNPATDLIVEEAIVPFRKPTIRHVDTTRIGGTRNAEVQIYTRDRITVNLPVEYGPEKSPGRWQIDIDRNTGRAVISLTGEERDTPQGVRYRPIIDTWSAYCRRETGKL